MSNIFMDHVNPVAKFMQRAWVGILISQLAVVSLPHPHRHRRLL
jgi:hypothetical protein